MTNTHHQLTASLAAFFGTAGALLGWKGSMLLLLAAAMLLDYLSGTLAAKRAGTWSSRAAREGLMHKGGIIFVSTAALLSDELFRAVIPEIPLAGGFENPGVFLPLVLAWYILTELGSILENAERSGAPVPKWFKNAIRSGAEGVAKTGEEAEPWQR